MPIKIRCPHCYRVLMAEDKVAGQKKRCPACERVIDVPLPISETLAHKKIGSKCPRCGHDVAPGTSYCQKCYTDLESGKRLPFKRRLALMPMRTWAIPGLVVIFLALAAIVGFNLYRTHQRNSQSGAGPTGSSAEPGIDWAQQLLNATGRDQRNTATAELAKRGIASASAIAAALEQSLSDRNPGTQRRRNQLAAIDLLGKMGGMAADPADRQQVLLKCSRREGLRERALCARAMLGDSEVVNDAVALWLQYQRRMLFLQRAVTLAYDREDRAGELTLRRSRAATTELTAALRELKKPALERAAAAHCQSWAWLGQQRGELLSKQLFELAKPRDDRALSVEEAQETSHDAHLALAEVGQTGSALARAGAGLTLAECTPQYKQARERYIAALAASVPNANAGEQQKAVWAVAKLTGRMFGEFSGEDEPTDVRRETVQSVLGWAAGAGMVDAVELRTAERAYRAAPALTCRVVPIRRQLETDLLEALQSGWSAVGPALDRWYVDEVGCSPRVLELLDPGQRNPEYCALAAAMIIVAESGEEAARRRLELWHQATDQPAWVRAMAYTALGALDARMGNWRSGWPADLDPDAFTQLGRGEPDWDHFGRLVAAGGAQMLERLKNHRPAPLSPEILSKLVRAAEEALSRRAREEVR